MCGDGDFGTQGASHFGKPCGVTPACQGDGAVGLRATLVHQQIKGILTNGAGRAEN